MARDATDLASLVKDFFDRGGCLWACTPCVKPAAEQKHLIEGVAIAGSGKIHELVEAGRGR